MAEQQAHDPRVVLITGASSGLGEQFARLYAARGENLLLVARREERLKALAAELEQKRNVRVDYLPLDLSLPDSRQRLFDTAKERGHVVETLVNNAGFGVVGSFAGTDLSRSMEMVRLNVDAVVELTGLFLPAMLEQHKGYVINVASTGAFQPVAGMAVYGATKSFVLDYTLALWAETKDSGVKVLCLCPGYTPTEFASVAGEPTNPFIFKPYTARQVVKAAVKALFRNVGYVVAAPPDQVATRWFAQLSSPRLSAQFAKRLYLKD